MNCYRCGTTEELSIHARRKTMISMICRPCRRERMNTYLKHREARNTPTKPKLEYWEEQALSTLERLSRKYA